MIKSLSKRALSIMIVVALTVLATSGSLITGYAVSNASIGNNTINYSTTVTVYSEYVGVGVVPMHVFNLSGGYTPSESWMEDPNIHMRAETFAGIARAEVYQQSPKFMLNIDLPSGYKVDAINVYKHKDSIGGFSYNLEGDYLGLDVAVLEVTGEGSCVSTVTDTEGSTTNYYQYYVQIVVSGNGSDDCDTCGDNCTCGDKCDCICVKCLQFPCICCPLCGEPDWGYGSGNRCACFCSQCQYDLMSCICCSECGGKRNISQFPHNWTCTCYIPCERCFGPTPCNCCEICHEDPCICCPECDQTPCICPLHCMVCNKEIAPKFECICIDNFVDGIDVVTNLVNTNTTMVSTIPASAPIVFAIEEQQINIQEFKYVIEEAVSFALRTNTTEVIVYNCLMQLKIELDRLHTVYTDLAVRLTNSSQSNEIGESINSLRIIQNSLLILKNILIPEEQANQGLDPKYIGMICAGCVFVVGMAATILLLSRKRKSV